MRFMILVKANKDSEAGVLPAEEMIATMADFHEELSKAGVLLDANGLRASSKGWRIKWSKGKRTIVNGPFTEAKEVVGGYAIVNAKDRQDAEQFARQFMEVHKEHWPAFEGECEVRPLEEETQA